MHLLKLCWCHWLLLSSILLHTISHVWHLWHSHWLLWHSLHTHWLTHWLLWHTHWHLSISKVRLLLHTDVDINIWIYHCLILICLIYHILVRKLIWSSYVVMANTLVYLWTSGGLKWHGLESFLFLNKRPV
jgi:hypothetical protein